MTDDPDDQRDGPPDADARPRQETDDRRSVWSHRIAVAVLVTFAAFVLFNFVTVLVMVYTSATRGGGSPFGP